MMKMMGARRAAKARAKAGARRAGQAVSISPISDMAVPNAQKVDILMGFPRYSSAPPRDEEVGDFQSLLNRFRQNRRDVDVPDQFGDFDRGALRDSIANLPRRDVQMDSLDAQMGDFDMGLRDRLPNLPSRDFANQAMLFDQVPVVGRSARRIVDKKKIAAMGFSV